MAITVVQAPTPAKAAAATSLSITLSATTSGNLLVVGVVANPDSTPGAPTVTVKLGTTSCTRAENANNGAFVNADVWYLANIPGSQTTVTATSSVAAEMALFAYEISGCATSSPLDKVAGATATGSPWSSTATSALAQASEIAIGVQGGAPSAASYPAYTGPGSPWTNTATVQIGTSLHNAAIAGYDIVSATTAVTYNGTATNLGNNATVVATFKGAATAGAAALSAAASVTAAGVETLQQAAALSAAASVTAGAHETIREAAALSAAASMAAVPTLPFDPLPSVDFPADALDVRVELQLAGTWTDITGYVQHDPATIERGHPDESTTTSPTVLNLSVANGDGRFTSGNPLSPYYPNLRRNVPCRVSLPEGASYLRLEADQASYAQGPSSGGVSITGDLDIQIDLTLDNWQAEQTLACKWDQTGNERSWLLEMEDDGTLGFWVSTAGSDQSSFFSTATPPSPPLLRQCLRVTYQASTGTATFYTAPAGLTGASWTQLGSALTYATSLPPFGCTAPVLLGNRADSAGWPGMYGKIHAFLLLSGIAGTTKASPDFTAQTAGATSFADAQSNTWTLEGTSEVSDRKYRCHVEMPSWSQSQDPTGSTVYAKLQGGGILRRIGMGETPASSPMTRAYLRLPADLNLGGYWSAEDGPGSVQIASGIGGLAAAGAGTVTLSSGTGFACSAALPVMNGGTITCTLGGTGPQVTWTDNVVRFLLAVPGTDDTNGTIICRVLTTGTIARLELAYGTGGSLALNGYNSAGTAVAGAAIGPLSFGLDVLAECRVSVEIRSNGTTGLWVVTPQAAYYDGGGGTFSGTVGTVTSVQFGNGLVGSTMGQFSAQGVWDTLEDLGSPLAAWAGETAGNRFARLCGEEGISFRGRGQLSATPALGIQDIETIDELLQECADADLGIWTETRQCLGFGYRTRNSIGNMDPAVSMSFDADNMDLWSSDPVEDDQIVVNDVTVTQSVVTSAQGTTSTQVQSSAHIIADTGNVIPGGNLAVSLIGRYDQTYDVNIATAHLLDNAGWRAHMGTVDEPRYPGIAIDLANMALAQAGLILPLLDMDLGDRLTMQFPPAWLPPGTADQIDQVMNGVTETLWVARTLGQAWQGVPYSPWPVATIGDDTYGWIDTDGSQIYANATYGASTIEVQRTSATYAFWSTNSADYPFLLSCQGMVIEVSGCSGSSDPQTLTVSQWGVNGVQVNLTAGSDIRLAYPAILGM